MKSIDKSIHGGHLLLQHAESVNATAQAPAQAGGQVTYKTRDSNFKLSLDYY